MHTQSFEHWYDLCPPCTPAWTTGPLLASCSSLTHQRLSITQTPIPKAHHTCRYLQGPTWISCPHDNPAHTWSPLLASCSELLLLDTHLHTWFVGCTELPPPEKHPGCEWLSHSSCGHGASQCPCSCCCCGHQVFLPQWL